ncbi:Putative selenium-dependent hydroxylase accessory protein YqeC like protein [Aduncisulcus paluster]|uniref:Selenium-dependent hydroxylase accessory protein YqeC like protein n=1 Tax=Aduncisulcus paluster TaxID=2918883 RepID=A0ABQ5KCY6_9EUKA|nr:Putative selenium-dependent hydroxylase accessory protein YqeC like protein [Aduncisulcus paluster]
MADTLDLFAGYDIISIVGGGGKTSLTFALAEKFKALGRVVAITTTTRMRHVSPKTHHCVDFVVRDSVIYDSTVSFKENLNMIATNRLLLQKQCTQQGCPKIRKHKSTHDLSCSDGYSLHSSSERSLRIQSGIVGFISSGLYDGKEQGTSPQLACDLLDNDLVDVVIIEADGARGKPLKAALSYRDPVIPTKFPHSFSYQYQSSPSIANYKSCFVCMVGADALGAKLTEKNVYRHDIVARILKIPPKSVITPDHISKLIFHPKRGYVWPIMTFSKKEMHVKKVSIVVFLNKCDLIKDWNRDLWIGCGCSGHRGGHIGSPIDVATESLTKEIRHMFSSSSFPKLSPTHHEVVTSQVIKAFFKDIPKEIEGSDGIFRVHKVAGSLKEGILRRLK